MEILVTMEEERYSNRQIERMIDVQTQDIKDHIDKVTAPILNQVLKTNGRVNKAEEDIVKYKVWRGWMTGGMAVIMIILPIFVGLLTWMVLRIVNLPNTVQAAVVQAFDDQISSKITNDNE